ncbi:hypothetical protein OSTOST_02883 [Ostertagia ostertagi]
MAQHLPGYPSELEALLITHPRVAEAAVVAISDHEAGERPVAFVVLDKDKPASTKQIMDYVNERWCDTNAWHK